MTVSAFLKFNKAPILFSFLSIAFYAVFAYDLVRTDFVKLISLYAALFILFFKLVQISKSNFRFLVIISVIFRLVFLVSIPNLSQDFYRFIWDGRMLIEGMNPYLFTPQSFIDLGKLPIAQAKELYDGMGMLNGSHYSNYPPIKQMIFAFAALFSGKTILGSVIVMRVFLIAADLGTLYFGKKLLKKMQLPVHSIFWFILNPFIIIELTGNLHFEGVMVFFLVWGLYLIYSDRWKLAAIAFGLSVSVKLIPLLFLPLFFKWFVQKERGIWKLAMFYSIVGLTTTVLFLPFVSSDMFSNYAATSSLWFNRFEFNASLYYIARSIGYAFTGYNEIAIIGKITSALVVLTVLGITFFRKNHEFQVLMSSMLLAITVHFFLSTTVHPWYLATALALSVFTGYKYPLVWTFVVVLSYFAYSNINYQENLWIIALEYTIVFGVFVWEVFLKKRFSF